MATSSLVSMSIMPTLTCKSQKKQPILEAFFKPLPIRPSKQVATSKSSNKSVVIKASSSSSSTKEKLVAGLSAGVLTAAMVVPDVALAVDGVSPSLKNFLLSIVSGGVVAAAIVGAVIGVSNFDPVKRG